MEILEMIAIFTIGLVLPDGRPYRHRAKPGRNAGAVQQKRNQLPAPDRGARNVRTARPPEIHVHRHLLRPDSPVRPQTDTREECEKICAIHQDDEFGMEVLRGGEAALKTLGMEFAEKTSFKRGATDFSSQVARMKAAGCDFVILGTVIRETIGAIAEARKTGFNPTFLGSAASYTELIPKLGGKAMDGMYATMTVQQPYLDEAAQPLRFWANKYKTRFNEDPSVFPVYGYIVIDTFIQAARKAGPNLSTDSFARAMDSLTIEPDIFGSARASYGPQKHLGSDLSRLSQIIDGRWRVVSDYVRP